MTVYLTETNAVIISMGLLHILFKYSWHKSGEQKRHGKVFGTDFVLDKGVRKEDLCAHTNILCITVHLQIIFKWTFTRFQTNILIK